MAVRSILVMIGSLLHKPVRAQSIYPLQAMRFTKQPFRFVFPVLSVFSLSLKQPKAAPHP